jgi:beta-glucanase (GH16 family)
VLGVSLAMLAQIVIPTSNVAFAAAPAGYSLKWADEFSGASVDTSKWNYRTDIRFDSAQRPQNVTLSGGAMIINLKKENYNGKSYTGGGLISKARFRYGYYETRAKLHPGSGWHGAFWAMRGDGSSTGNPERRTEIDGFEIDTNKPNINYHSIHRWAANGSDRPSSCGKYDMGFNSALDFHVYGFAWTEASVTYYVDGAPKCTLAYQPNDHEHDRINIWLTAIAGTQLSGPIDDSTLPGKIIFDYIRFYERDPYIDNGEQGYSETGAWANSSLQGYSYSTSRYACANAAATWTPNILAAGVYQVYLYKIVYNNGDTNARIDVVANGATTTKYVNFTSGSTGWVDLGTHSFAAGSGGYVKNTRSNGCARADMVKFVKR